MICAACDKVTMSGYWVDTEEETAPRPVICRSCRSLFYKDDAFQCKVCGEWDAESNWSAYALEPGHCFDCSFWKRKVRNYNDTTVIVEGAHFIIGDESQRGSRGFAGVTFYIKFHDGRQVKSTNLWSQGKIPDFWRESLKDNAVFCKSDWSPV